MNISLTPELEQLVSDKVKTGMYQSDLLISTGNTD